MVVHQFYDKGLAHASYAVIRTGRMIVIDPARDPQPYYEFAAQHNADIAGVIETHPHADFVSAHLEIHQTTGAVIYVSKLAGAEYPHETFDDGDVISINDIKLKAMNTPGHSPDSICIILEDESGRDCAIFTGDTLFAGDVGRPDLRETAGNITAKKEELARDMYRSTRNMLMLLPKDITVYPAHGPGSLCGKSMSPDLQTTIGKELRENYALQLMDELAFVNLLTADQPFMPKYFGYDVELNKKGAPKFAESISAVNKPVGNIDFEDGVLVIDTRSKETYSNGHLIYSINLQDGEKFETWLGSIINPGEPFYLIAATNDELNTVIKKTAKIGYEQSIKAALLTPANAHEQSPVINEIDFKSNPDNYTIVDVRNWAEINTRKIFNNALTIPLPELRDRISEIPADKPIVIHCAAGYRSAAAWGIISAHIKAAPVYDLSDAVKGY
jgi:hydroxyacylglutathione hydrolase